MVLTERRCDSPSGLAGDQSTATGQCVDCSRHDRGNEKEEVTHHPLFVFLLLLVLVLMLVRSKIDAAVRRSNIMQPAGLPLQLASLVPANGITDPGYGSTATHPDR